MMVKHWRLLVVACGLSAVTASHAACPFNVAGGANADAMRDGVLLVRYANGLRGAALVAGTGITDFTTIQNTILARTSVLDINGNGAIDTTDAAVISRVLFGYSNGTLTTGMTVAPFSMRDSLTVMNAYVAGGCSSTYTADQQRAARFLTRTTFGASAASIGAFNALAEDGTVTGDGHKRKASAWVNAQIGMARASKHYDYIVTKKAEVDAYNLANNADTNFGNEVLRESFWNQAIAGNDQLRQRTALALSEVLVVSSYGGSTDAFELAAYLDILADGAFGNFRDILYNTALSPAMGRFLSHLRNDGGSTNPNENFAREILQLFSVGLVMLNDDGTPKSGNPPSYDENTVKGFAKVFTGFSFDDPYCNTTDPSYGIPLASCNDGYNDLHPSWNWSPDRTDIGANFPPVMAGWKRPMVPFFGRHSKLSKQLLTYTTYPSAVASCSTAIAQATAGGLLPALTVGTTGSGTRVTTTQAYATVNAAIDNIFCHPNVGPFISKHLIKLLVTSTPSPAFVARVTAKFNNNGINNTRGDMTAVLKAILLDDEAITPENLTTTDRRKFGKLKAPILRLSALLRAFPGTPPPSGKYKIHDIDSLEYGINQGPLQSPTVFNFYHPDFSPPGPLKLNNALGPEFEITTTTSIAATQNFFGNAVVRDSPDTPYKDYGLVDVGYRGSCERYTTVRVYTDCMYLNYSDLYLDGVWNDSTALFEYINLVLMGGRLPVSAREGYVTALNTQFSPTVTGLTTAQLAQRKRDRVKAAVWLAVHSPEFQIQY